MSTRRHADPRGRSRWVRFGIAGFLVVALGVTTAWAFHRGTPPVARSGDALAAAGRPAGGPLSAVPEPPVQSIGPASAPPSAPASPSVSPSAAKPGSPRPETSGRPANTGKSRSVEVTLYGGRDNDPPGSDEIAYPTLHGHAGGTGSYADPITFATSKALIAVGTRIYVPYLKRYFIMEDDCVECDADQRSGKAHVDLWAGASTAAGILDCEDSLTRGSPQQILVGPSAGLPVVTTPIYDGSRCYRA